MTKNFKQDKKEWIDNNPLRSFRKEKGLTQSDVANHLGTSLTAVQYWEQGTNFPDKDNMDKLSELLKNPNLERKWYNWQNERPKIA